MKKFIKYGIEKQINAYTAGQLIIQQIHIWKTRIALANR